jgi:hypothetical protein
VFAELLTSSGFGAVVGMRHALEPDHFAAVATLIGSERSSARAALLGVYWGLGHTLAIVMISAALVMLQAEMPESASTVIDMMVATMLVILGVRAMLQGLCGGSRGLLPADGLRLPLHRHAPVPGIANVGAWPLARRPLLVGAVHGLAGSGALTALVLTALPNGWSRFAYVALFGAASTLGMAAMSGLLGWPLAWLGMQHAVTRSIVVVVGFGSAALGVALAKTTVEPFYAGAQVIR